MKEEWRPVVGFEEFYEVSSIGRIKRTGVDSAGRRRYIGHFLMQHVYGGYLKVGLCRNNKLTNKAIHIAMAEAFIGPRPIGMQVNHKDGDKLNNTIDNLEYVTPSENYRHALEVLGHQPVYGERHWNAKVSNKDVIEIRRRVANGENQYVVAADFGIRQGNVSRIASRVRRKKA